MSLFRYRGHIARLPEKKLKLKKRGDGPWSTGVIFFNFFFGFFDIWQTKDLLHGARNKCG